MSVTDNKYNPSKGDSNNNPLGYFPIKQHRWDTRKHPIINRDDKCSYSFNFLCSAQETQMIQGLANSFQCSTRDAIRISLYELQNSDNELDREILSRAASGTKERGHTARTIKVGIRLTKSEKESALRHAKKLDIAEKAYIRLAFIWMARGIKDGSITKISCSRKKSQLKLFREWSKTYDGSGTKLKALKDARDEERDLKIYLDEKRIDESRERYENPIWLNNQLDQYDLEESAFNDDWIQSLGSIEDKEILIRDRMRRFELTYKEATLWVEDELAESDMLAGMTPREQLSYFKREDQLRDEEAAQFLRTRAEQRKDASIKQHHLSDEQRREYEIRSHEQALTRLIREQEDEADRKAYLEDPALWGDETP